MIIFKLLLSLFFVVGSLGWFKMAYQIHKGTAQMSPESAFFSALAIGVVIFSLVFKLWF